MKRLAIAGLALLGAACEPGPAPEPLVVLVPEDRPAFADALARYTDQSGIPLTMRRGPSAELSRDVVDKRGDPPADVLVTSNVIDIWRAADAGALRPIDTASLDRLPELLRDPEGYWAGLSPRFHAVVRRNEVRPLVADYDTLAETSIAGRLCLSSSELASNRVWIAMLIEERGMAGAERLMRLLVRNLAAKPFGSRAALLEAVRSGQCDYAVATWPDDSEGVVAFLPEPQTFDVDAIGVGRHAGQPEAAQAFVGWVIEAFRTDIRGETERLHPGTAGYRDEEARLLADRVGYR